MEKNPTYKKYWTDRGYTEEQASFEIKKKKKVSPEHWIAKGFDISDANEMASFEAKKRNILCIEYWIDKGFSEEESLLKSNIEKDKKEFPKLSRDKNILCIEYWTAKGFSKEESKKEIQKEQQKRNTPESIKKMIHTQKKNNQTPERKSKIKKQAKEHSKRMKAKGKTHSPIFKEYWVAQGLSNEEAKDKVIEVKYKNKYGNYGSKIEDTFFDKLEKCCKIKFERNKFITIKRNVYCPDGKYENIIVEFNGTNPHLDDRFHDSDSKTPWGKSFEQKHNEDDKKITNLKTKYSVFVIWEYDFLNKETELLEILTEKMHEISKERKYWDSSCL